MPARRITLPLFARPDVALDQRIAQSLAVDLDLAAAGLGYIGGVLNAFRHTWGSPYLANRENGQVLDRFYSAAYAPAYALRPAP